MDSAAKKREEDRGESKQEQAADLAAAFKLLRRQRFSACFVGLRIGLGDFRERGHRAYCGSGML